MAKTKISKEKYNNFIKLATEEIEKKQREIKQLEDNRWVICPRKTLLRQQKRCPICEWLAEQNVRRGQDEAVDAVRPKERQLFNFVDLNDLDAGVQILDISHFFFGETLEEVLETADAEDKFGKFADLPGGKNLKLGLKEDQFGIKAKTLFLKDRHEELDLALLDETHVLDELFNILSYKELKEAFLSDEVEINYYNSHQDNSKIKKVKPKKEEQLEIVRI